MRRDLFKRICLIFVSVIWLVFFMTGCEGPEGKQGDQGTPGIQGPQGLEGPQGPAGQDAVNYPIINSIVANPPVMSISETGVIRLYYAYAGTEALSFNWTATSGTITGHGDSAVFIAPSVAGSYIVNIRITAGEYVSTGAVSILVISPDEPASYEYSGRVTSITGGGLSGVMVFSSPLNFAYSQAAGNWVLNSPVSPIDVSFFMNDHQAFSLYDVTSVPNLSLRESDVVAPVNYYSVDVNINSMLYFEDTLAVRVSCTNGRQSQIIKIPPSYPEPERLRRTITLDSIPEGRWQFYAVANDLISIHLGMTTPVDINSHTEVDVNISNPKAMQVRTILNLPTGPIENFAVTAYVDSTVEMVGSNIPDGRMILNYNRFHNRSNRDSVSIGGDLFIGDRVLSLDEYHLQLTVTDRNDNVCTQTLRNIRWGAYWVAFNMAGTFPSARMTMVSGRPSFNISGTGDVFVIDIERVESWGYQRVWRGITQGTTVEFPQTPEGTNILTPGEYRWRLYSIVAPRFDISDDNIDVLIDNEMEYTPLNPFTYGASLGKAGKNQFFNVF